MSEIVKSGAISRRRALSLFGKVAASAVVTAAAALTASDAEAETVGMERRQERRLERHERREDRRTARTERREERRTGTTIGTGTSTTTGIGTGPKQ
jgi:Ni/Co efflux regulator RcnB